VANYDALINLKIKGFDQLKKVEKELNNITNPKKIKRSVSQKFDQSELSFLRTKNSALSLANRAHRTQNKLKGSGVNIEKQISELERIGNLKEIKSLGNLKEQIELRKKDVLVAEKSLAVRTKEAKTVKSSLKTTKTSPTVVSHSALMGPHKATKGAGQAAMSIDTITKQSDKRFSMEMKLRQLEAKGVNTAKLRAKMGELVDAQNRKEFGDIKRINREIGRGIAKEESKLKILRIQNQERNLENKKILEANKMIAKEITPQGAFSRRSDKKSRDVQGKRTFMNNRFARMGLPMPTKGFDMQSALISGAFPLLFGQGPIGAAAGALGGGIGGMFGEMGGFAGGIAATAIVQQIQSAITAIGELGKALGPFSQNTEAVTNALGLQGSAQQAQIQLIEQTKGKTAAFNAAMKFMSSQIGEAGVNSLKVFGENSRLITASMTIAATKLKALGASILNFLLNISGAQRALNKADQERTVAFAASRGDKEAKAIQEEQKRINNMEKVDRLVAAPSGGLLPSVYVTKVKSPKAEQDQINLDKRKEAFAIGEKERVRMVQANSEQQNHTRTLEEQFALRQKTLKFVSQGESQALAEKLAKNELINEKAIENFKIRQTEIKQQLDGIDKQIDLGKKNIDDKKKLQIEEEKIKDLLKGQGDILANNNKMTRELHNDMDKFRILNEEIANILATNTTSAIMGLIDGTKSLSESLSGVARQLASLFLNKAFGAMFGGIFQAEGGYNRAGSFKAFQYGGVVSSPTLGMIGEGGEPEYVIPSSKMDGAMARYSAGARGGAVIPGGSGESGSVAGSSGNTIVEYTGPVLNFNGDEYVPKSSVPQIISAAAKQGATLGQSKTLNTLKNSRSSRSKIGI